MRRTENCVRDDSTKHDYSDVFVGGQPAGLLYLQARQINFQVPQDLPREGTVDLKVIHQNRFYKWVLVQFVRDRFPDLRGADDGAVLAFVKQRAR